MTYDAAQSMRLGHCGIRTRVLPYLSLPSPRIPALLSLRGNLVLALLVGLVAALSLAGAVQ